MLSILAYVLSTMILLYTSHCSDGPKQKVDAVKIKSLRCRTEKAHKSMSCRRFTSLTSRTLEKENPSERFHQGPSHIHLPVLAMKHAYPPPAMDIYSKRYM